MQKYILLVFLMAAFTVSAIAQTEIQDGEHRNYHITMTKEAEYPGGNTQLYKQLAAQMQYPAEAKEKRITGDIMVSFFVEADSTTSDIRALKDLGGGTKQEAERLIKGLKFSPAIQNGKPVRQQMMLPVLFRIYD
jgi:periplasmic protein TonB